MKLWKMFGHSIVLSNDLLDLKSFPKYQQNVFFESPKTYFFSFSQDEEGTFLIRQICLQKFLI